MARPIFTLTNDPDHGTVERYKAVFDTLNKLGLRITTAVFCAIEEDGSSLAKHCRVGETHCLNDDAFRDLMIEQAEFGHEIAYHGYSQISNTRAKFIEGLDIFKDIFGHDPFTYIEHGGNPTHHPLDMCKRETLMMDGMNPESDHYVMDLLQERIGCVWAFEALDEDLECWPEITNIFYRLDDVLFFRRQRMFRLDAAAYPAPDGGGCFVGYTHFGYDGYELKPENRLEKWSEQWLHFAEQGLSQMLEHVQPENLTMRELVNHFETTEAAQ